MKAVAMMKQAIADHKANGNYNPDYKWTADKRGLHWSYMNTDFLYEYEEGTAQFRDYDSGIGTAVIVAQGGEGWLIDRYHEFVKTAEEAVYWAARKIIAKAEYLY